MYTLNRSAITWHNARVSRIIAWETRNVRAENLEAANQALCCFANQTALETILSFVGQIKLRLENHFGIDMKIVLFGSCCMQKVTFASVRSVILKIKLIHCSCLEPNRRTTLATHMLDKTSIRLIFNFLS